MYHNTTESIGRELLAFCRTTRSQDELVLKAMQILMAFREKGWTASEVRDRMIRMKLITERVPLTSIRRALSNLSQSGDVIKTDKQEPGPYGRPEFLYRLPTGQLRLV